ncbi:MAG: glycosyltransferase family 2 protein [Verrucomicrobiota bacterium]
MGVEDRSSICAVLTAFNRREKTLKALKAFFEQSGAFNLSAVLMDDGSTDGTGEAVEAQFEQVKVLRGDGSLFWNRGMAAAYAQAREQKADFYLWLNDDTLIDSDAVARLVSDAQEVESPCIIVGSTRDPDSGEFTYGGLKSASSWHSGKFGLIPPTESPQPCVGMNGNVVLISHEAAELTGGIDKYFSHSMGDYDYALSATKAGVRAYVGRAYHGTCARNPKGAAWHEKGSIRERWKAVNSFKGLPMKEWAYFLRKHGTWTWPLAWLLTYRRILTG